MKRLENSYRSMASVLPKKAKWLKEKAVEFDPKNNTVITSTGNQVKYDLLLIASGLQLNYDKVSVSFKFFEYLSLSVYSRYPVWLRLSQYQTVKFVPFIHRSTSIGLLNAYKTLKVAMLYSLSHHLQSNVQVLHKKLST